jgi:hypothetical protein
MALEFFTGGGKVMRWLNKLMRVKSKAGQSVGGIRRGNKYKGE